MNKEINSINQILTNKTTGRGKGRAVKRWIRSVLRKIVDYKQQHHNILTEATATLVEVLSLPEDIVMKLVLLFSNCHHTRLK
jgi:hypothetical protein